MLTQSIEDANLANNKAQSSLEKKFMEQAALQLKSQYEAYAAVEQTAYALGQRVAFMLLTQVALFPLALSLLPGISNGAIIAKLTMPSSTLPGWIIISAPIFYVPVVSVSELWRVCRQDILEGKCSDLLKYIFRIIG
jgi:hypothetical protein